MSGFQGSLWCQRSVVRNVVGIGSEIPAGSVLESKVLFRSQQIYLSQGRLLSCKRQSQRTTTLVNSPHRHGEGNFTRFSSGSFPLVVQSSTRLGTQQSLAANSLSRSLDDEVLEGRNRDEGDPIPDTDNQLDSIGEFNLIPTLNVSSQGTSRTEDEDLWHADDDEVPTLNLDNQMTRRQKKAALGVRKPSQGDQIKGDFNSRFGLLSRVARNGQASKSVEANDIDYYVPQVGHEVIGVIVSGNEYKIDVDVGASQLGRMLTKDVYPLDLFQEDEFFWEMPDGEEDEEQELPVGRVRVVRDEESLTLSPVRGPIVEVGTVLKLKVQGVTLSGRPILSSRKVANCIAWERVRQIHKQDEPFEVHIIEWNSGGLLAKIEGLRAFLPINQFLNKSNGTVGLKARVGEQIYVLITEVDEHSGKLIISEKRAWGWRHLRPGALQGGVVNKIFPFGVEVNLTGTSMRGMIHISNVSRARVKDLEQVFSVGEEVKAMVVKSPIPHRIALSTADLESSKGLILQDKEKVFREASEMAAVFRNSLLEDQEDDESSVQESMEENEIANWDWLHFGEETESVE